MAMQAPVGIVILRGTDLVVELANESYLSQVGRERSELLNKPLFTSLPEIKEVVAPLLQDVLKTGESFYGNEFAMTINRYGNKEQCYFNFVCQALRETDGSVNGVMVTATEVTQIVHAKHTLQENEIRLRLATEGTQLATWDLDLQTGDIVHSPRLAVVFGHAESKILLHVQMQEQIHPDDRHIIKKGF